MHHELLRLNRKDFAGLVAQTVELHLVAQGWLWKLVLVNNEN